MQEVRYCPQVIEDNPANYTAWAWRWRCLAGGCGDKAAELAFLTDCTLGGAKNYQLWNHRRHVALDMGPLDAAQVGFAAGVTRHLARHDPGFSHVR